VRDSLNRWREAGTALDPMIDRAPALQEARPLAKNLEEIAAAGLEALEYLSTGDAPTAEWRAARLAKLDEAAKPSGALELVIVPSVRKLIIAAAEQRQPR